MEIGKFMQTAANRDYSRHWQSPGSFPWMAQQPQPPLPERPHSVSENYIRCVTGQKPWWMPAYMAERNTIWPDAIEEHPVPEVNGLDWWGVDWYMVEAVGGMITRPGTRVISDFANWKEEVQWPDLSLVDFEADGRKIQASLDPRRVHVFECVEGIFERLHEMMPFDETLLAFYEEPELLEEFFQKMADYKIECCRQVFTHYGRVDGVQYHDDWGTQRAGFFSNEMFRNQIMPATKRLTDYIKSQGKFIELHSCGKNMQYVPEMIELGIDMWTPQLPINDPVTLYEQYGEQMTFCFGLSFDPRDTEAEVRRKVRDFVDQFGGKGRCMPFFRIAPGNTMQKTVAHEELYHYSLDFYNKLYGRE